MKGKFHFTRWAIVCLVVVVALASIGVTYARMKGPKPPKDDVVATSGFSDPFSWVATNDDGHLDYHDLYSPTDPVDPGDDGGATEYDMWGASSSNDPYEKQNMGSTCLRYENDVAKTEAWLGLVSPDDPAPDPQYITVLIDNAYPYYYSTVFFALKGPESVQGVITDIVIDEKSDDTSLPEPDTIGELTVTYSGIYIGQPIPTGGEVVGALHILVEEEADQNATYKIRLSITTEGKTGTSGSAYAYGGNDYAHCFDEFGFSNWGWTNGPLEPGEYNFGIYAGAGGCEPTDGTLVGELTVNYYGSTAIVTYNMYEGYTIDETHLYVGTEELPTNKKGNPTVSPGQYPYSNNLKNATTDSYTINSLSGDIYVVAHAVVCWFR